MAETDTEADVPFALGCMTFEVADSERGFEWKYADWRAEVVRVLEALPNIAAVNVEQFKKWPGQKDSWMPEAVHQPGETPRPHRFEPSRPDYQIVFDISIPRRMHSDLAPWFEPMSCESFRVVTTYGFHGPYTFLYPLSECRDPSRGLVLVRRYLEREVPKHSSKIKVTNLGPSPFHANGILRKGADDQDTMFAFQLVSRVGYKRLTFTYQPELFGGGGDAVTYLQRQLGAELSLFYRLIRSRNYMRAVAHYVATKSNVLVERHQRTGFRAWFGRIFRSAGSARELGLMAIGAQSQLTSARLADCKVVDSLYEQSYVVGALEDDLREELLPETDPEIQNALALVDFLEGSRSKEMEIAVVGASTLLGGLAGAIAAIVAGG